jgi:hypothetical protein
MAPESFLVGLAGFSAYIVIYLLMLRWKVSTGWFSLQVLTGALVVILSAGLGFWRVHQFSIFYALALFGFLWFCFFFVSGIFYVSVSLGIIYYLNAQPGKSASVEELYWECIRKPFINRVDLIEKLGAVSHSEQGYFITEMGKQIVRRIKAIQNLLGLRIGGFYSVDPDRDEFSAT